MQAVRALSYSPSSLYSRESVSTPAVAAAAHPPAANMSRTILWFRNDLRLHDSSIVAEAVKAVKDKKCESVVPVFCFDPRFTEVANVIDRHPHKRFTGEPKIGKHRAQFLLESVTALKTALQAIGSDLYVYYDRPEVVLPGALSLLRSLISNLSTRQSNVPSQLALCFCYNKFRHLPC